MLLCLIIPLQGVYICIDKERSATPVQYLPARFPNRNTYVILSLSVCYLFYKYLNIPPMLL